MALCYNRCVVVDMGKHNHLSSLSPSLQTPLKATSKMPLKAFVLLGLVWTWNFCFLSPLGCLLSVHPCKLFSAGQPEGAS